MEATRHSKQKIKRAYEKPLVQIIELDAQDVLAACSTPSNGALLGPCQLNGSCAYP